MSAEERLQIGLVFWILTYAEVFADAGLQCKFHNITAEVKRTVIQSGVEQNLSLPKPDCGQVLQIGSLRHEIVIAISESNHRLLPRHCLLRSFAEDVDLAVVA